MPWEFWDLTPGEFLMRLEGFLRLEDRAWERTGTLGLWVLSPHRSKNKAPLTLRKLLGRTLQLWPTRRGTR